MTLSDSLKDYIAAAFAGIWINTLEPDEAQREIGELAQQEKWELFAWDCARGIHGSGDGKGVPLAPFQLPPQQPDKTRLVVLWNYHRFVNTSPIWQALANAVMDGKSSRCFYLVLSPINTMPQEIEKLFVVVEHQLPDSEQLKGIFNDMIQAGCDVACMEPAIESATGLTRYEAENAFALSLVRHGTIKPETIWEIKEGLLKKSGLLSLHRGKETFRDLGGLDNLKGFCRKALSSRSQKPRGILLVGVSGTGKSAFAKALGGETGRPVLMADPGSWKGSLVGETGEKTRRALRIADAMSPCILFIDEIEKALAGATSQHQGDSGVSADQLGALLTWLNDHTSDVFVICTSNNIQQLPPEFSRAERFDGIFFIDFPSEQEKVAIWKQYRETYHLEIAGAMTPSGIDFRPCDDNWTGAEIKSCCRLSALLNIPLAEAAQNIVPVATSSPEKVSSLREWAGGKCLDASRSGLYFPDRKETETNGKPRRSVRVK